MAMVVGFDPGFASAGYSILDLRPGSAGLVKMGVWTTKKTPTKRNVYAADDTYMRSIFLAKQVRELRVTYPVQAVFAESMSFPRNASAAAKMAVFWGLLAANFETLPMVQLSPQQIKQRLCGSAKASKEDVREAVRKGLGESLPMEEFEHATKPDLWEHGYDAIASVLASLTSEIALMVTRL